MLNKVIMHKTTPNFRSFRSRIILKVVLNNKNLLVVCVYRSLASDVNIFFQQVQKCFLYISDKKFNEVIMCGDFNINFLDRKSIPCKYYSTNSLVFWGMTRVPLGKHYTVQLALITFS